jgi:hypothetical protein
MYHTSRQNIQILGKPNFYNFSESCYNDSMTKDTDIDANTTAEDALIAAEAKEAADLAELDTAE